VILKVAQARAVVIGLEIKPATAEVS